MGTYQPSQARKPTDMELDAEKNDGCILCHAKAGEPCVYLFRAPGTKIKFLREFKQRYGQGRWVHQARLEMRELRLAKEEQGQNA